MINLNNNNGEGNPFEVLETMRNLIIELQSYKVKITKKLMKAQEVLLHNLFEIKRYKTKGQTSNDADTKHKPHICEMLIDKK